LEERITSIFRVEEKKRKENSWAMNQGEQILTD
jgi:hypothetical protein